jgi:hypothetical protein
MELTRSGFSQVVANAFAGMGFSAEGPTIYEFPMPMFLPNSDLTPINENIDKIVYGLTKWQPKIKAKGIYAPDMVTVQGKDYREAVHSMNGLFLKNMWGDGLPLEPPTKERVDWILTGTDLPRNTVIGTITPRGGIATVEAIAVVLAMAGGRPEYLPVLIAAVEGIVDPLYNIAQSNPTTNSVYPAVIVNGPIAEQIRLSSGYGLLGPDPVRPAGQSIGRAIRLMLQDMGGAIPGIGTMAIYGGMRTTGAVFAEDEEGLPKGWPSLAEERGFKKGENALFVTNVSSMENILQGGDAKTPEALAEQYLSRLASYMAAPLANTFNYERARKADYPAGIIFIGRGTAAALADVGYTKEKVKQFLWEKSKVPWQTLVNTGNSTNAVKFAGIKAGEAGPITVTPSQITLVVAGGAQSGHSYWMQPGSLLYGQTSKGIKLPKNWDSLIKQAETDLGPAPAQ